MILALILGATLMYEQPVVDPYAARPYEYSTPGYRQWEAERARNQWNMDRNSEIIEREKEDYRHEEEMRELRKLREANERD